MTASGDGVIPDALTRLSRTLIDGEDVESTLVRICQLAITAVVSAECADVSLVVPGEGILTRGSTDELAEAVDRLQYEAGAGPCLSSIDRQATFRVDDMRTETRWPRFAKRAAEETGVRSMLAFVMKVDENALASLNMFSTLPGAFDESDERIGLVFATQAATVLANAETHARDRAAIEQLEDGLRTRGTIGRAIGILQGRQGLSESESVALLKKMSQTSNVKMRKLAEDIAAQAESDPATGDEG